MNRLIQTICFLFFGLYSVVLTIMILDEYFPKVEDYTKGFICGSTYMLVCGIIKDIINIIKEENVGKK